MAAPGGPRTGNRPPPNYNPNALADGMQNLQLNRPNQSPSAPRPNNPFGQQPPSAPRPNNTPFGQQQPPFAGGPAISRPGPPPPGVFPRGPSGGPPHTGLPPNVASRPTGPPHVAQSAPPFASRPPPPGAMPPSIGGTAPPSALGPRPGPPGPFASSPLTTGLAVPPPSSISSSVSNGPPAGGPGMMQGGGRFPPPSNTMRPPFGASPPAMVSSGTPSQPPSMRSPFGGPSSVSTSPVTTQPPAPFSGSLQNVPPPSGSSPFAAPGQGMPPPMGALYGTQSWQMPPHQGPPPSAIPGSMQPPSMYGMAPPLPNQAVASITPSIGHTSPSKVDPNQIPRPIPNASVVLHETRQGNQANPPPPATSDYIVRDTGNCSPRYMRCTLNQIPCTVDFLTTSAMPWALLVQPLALPHPSEEPLHVVDFGESGPVRCSRCKGYINPFVKFIDQGRRFICNLCGHTDETPRDYHCNLGPDGRRRDADERPELCRGTVEFVATKEYMVRDPMPAVYFFLIDVSMNAIQTGATAAACSAISQVITDLPEGPRTLVGVATFDSTIHFYNLKRA
uniref:Protein transport protein Sec24-like At4g32640 n=1 Tax=Nicotiana tabacum TaxID=4097 RepID=A0A1S4BW20_TOBAC